MAKIAMDNLVNNRRGSRQGFGVACNHMGSDSSPTFRGSPTSSSAPPNLLRRLKKRKWNSKISLLLSSSVLWLLWPLLAQPLNAQSRAKKSTNKLNFVRWFFCIGGRNSFFFNNNNCSLPLAHPQLVSKSLIIFPVRPWWHLTKGKPGYQLLQSTIDYPPPSGPSKCWRIIVRGGESRATELRKSVSVADSESAG